MSPSAPSPRSSQGLLGVTARVVACKLVASAAVAVVAILTARQLGPGGRGAFVLLLTLASFGALVCCLGVNTAARIHLVAEVDPVGPGDYLGLSSVLTAVQFVVCATIGVALLALVHVRLSAGEAAVFGLLGASLLAQYFLLDELNAYGLPAVAAALDAMGSLFQLGLVGLLVSMGIREMTPYVWALAIGGGVQVVLSLKALQRAGISIRPQYRRSQWKRLLGTGVSAIPAGLSQALTFRLDRYLLAFFLTPAAAGVYSVAASGPEMLRLVPLALSQPIFHRIAAGSAEAADFRRTRLACLGATVVMALATFAAAPLLVRTLFGVQYLAAVQPLRILLLAEVGITIFYLDGVILAGLNRVGRTSVAAVLGLFVVAAGDVAIIPSHGVVGAAWVSVVAYSIMGFAAHMFLRSSMSGPKRGDRHLPGRKALPGGSTPFDPVEFPHGPTDRTK